MNDVKPIIDVALIPEHIARDIAAAGVKAVREAFNDPAYRARFEEWKRRKEEKKGGSE